MKTKALISFAITAKLICAFVFTYAKSRASHYVAQLFMSWLIILTLKFTRKLAVIHKIGVIFSVYLNMSTLIFLCLMFLWGFFSMNALMRYTMHNFEIVVLVGWVSKG